MRFLTLVTPPATEPVDITLAKQHLRVDIADDETLITDYILTARTWVEKVLGRALITQTWDYIIDAFPGGSDTLELPKSPLQSVTSITYTDSNGIATVWPAFNYQVDAVNEPGQVLPSYGSTWPSNTLRAANGVAIRLVAGYGVATDVPWTYRMAILLLIAHWYENREPIMAQRGVTPIEIPFTVKALLGVHEIAGVS